MSDPVCDETCSCPLKESCLGRRYPEAWGVLFRQHWESGNPVLRSHVVNRSQLGWTPPAPAAAEAAIDPLPEALAMKTRGPAGPSVSRLPLAGDIVEAMAQRIGAARLAKWVEKKLGRPCGCQGRRDSLNRLDAAARKYLGRSPGSTTKP